MMTKSYRSTVIGPSPAVAGGSVVHDLRELVPLHPVAHLRTELPAQGLGAGVAELPDVLRLRQRVVGPRHREQVRVLARPQVDDSVQGPGHGAPPAPVIAHDLADAPQADRADVIAPADLVGREQMD